MQKRCNIILSVELFHAQNYLYVKLEDMVCQAEYDILWLKKKNQILSSLLQIFQICFT